MIVRQERWLSPPAVRAFTPALKRSNFGWLDVTRWMQGEGWAIWNIGGVGYVFTLVNDNDEIEVLLAGGERAKECVPHWEAAMLAHPAHKGMTLRMDGRKGWRRLLPDWELRGDGALYRRVGG